MERRSDADDVLALYEYAIISATVRVFVHDNYVAVFCYPYSYSCWSGRRANVERDSSSDEENNDGERSIL
jgi:hypothetical protein